MTINYTSLLSLAEPVTGTQSGTWGDDVNQGLTDYLDIAIAGAQVISGSQTAVTLSKTTGSSAGSNIAQVGGAGTTGSAQYAVINCTGNPASMLTITAPATSKTYVVINSTSTSQSVKLVGTGPTTGVTVATGQAALVAWKGADFTLIATTDASKLTGTLGVANGGTGQTTANAAFNALAPSQASANGKYLKSDGTNTSWDAIDISTSDISGVLLGANGGTGVNNSGKTITLGGNLTTSGAFNTTLTATNTTSLTLPTTGTLATLAGSETLTNKTISGASNTLSNIANASLTNSAITINGSAVSLGGSTTVTATTTNAVTFDNGGSGDASGTTFNGSAARTISYNTVGAPSTTGTGASGTWSININGTVGATTPDTGSFTRLRTSSVTTSTSGTVFLNSDNTNQGSYTITGTTTFGAPLGTPTDSQKLIYRLYSASAYALNWNAIFRPIGVTLPTTTVASKIIYVGCIYNSTDTKWDVVAVTTQV